MLHDKGLFDVLTNPPVVLVVAVLVLFEVIRINIAGQKCYSTFFRFLEVSRMNMK